MRVCSFEFGYVAVGLPSIGLAFGLLFLAAGALYALPSSLQRGRPGASFLIGRGNHSLDPHCIDAVVRMALYQEENREGGINRLSRILEGLVRKLNVEEDYPDYMEDTARIITGLQTIVSGSLAEEIAEDVVGEG